MEKLRKFYWDCGRSGSIEGLFFAKEDAIQKAIGKEVYFGEILGKHSEIYGNLEESDIKTIDLPEDVAKILIRELGMNISGYNPLDYIYEEDQAESDEVG